VSHDQALSLASLPDGASRLEGAPPADASPARLRALVTDNLAFVYRSLIRLGVPRADADDAVQQVFLVASRKLASIEPGREKAFLFGAAFRIAHRTRRTQKRRHEVLEAEPHERVDTDPSPEELLDRARARMALDAILETMPLELRAVFVLFELEQLTIAQIAPMLELPPGTAASRLRRAREHFQAAVRRLEAQRKRGGESS
jgi:RNA polymerase sigma-70 factor, ECF subfamily